MGADLSRPRPFPRRSGFPGPPRAWRWTKWWCPSVLDRLGAGWGRRPAPRSLPQRLPPHYPRAAIPLLPIASKQARSDNAGLTRGSVRSATPCPPSAVERSQGRHCAELSPPAVFHARSQKGAVTTVSEHMERLRGGSIRIWSLTDALGHQHPEHERCQHPRRARSCHPATFRSKNWKSKIEEIDSDFLLGSSQAQKHGL